MDYLVLGECLIEKTAISDGASRSGDFPIANRKPALLQDESRPTLRRFGVTLGIAFFLLGALLDFRHRASGRPLQSIATILLLLAGFAPGWLRFVYRPWMRLATLLGTISSAILLTVLFYLVVTPNGWLQRLFRQRPLDLRFGSADASYWERRSADLASARYENQF